MTENVTRSHDQQAMAEHLRRQAHESGPSSSQSLHIITTVLSDAQIKGLSTTPVEIVPSPGPGKALFHVMSIWKLDSRGGSYSISPSDPTKRRFQLDSGPTSWAWYIYDDAIGDGGNAFEQSGPDAINMIVGYSDQFIGQDYHAWKFTRATRIGDKPNIEDRPIRLKGEQWVGAVTGGHPDNTLALTVIYVVIDV